MENIFDMVDAGLRPTSVPEAKPENSDVVNTLKTVGIGHPEQSTSGSQPGVRTDTAAPSTTPDKDPRDEYFRPHTQMSLFNDIKARPIDGQGQDGTDQPPTNDTGKIVAR